MNRSTRVVIFLLLAGSSALLLSAGIHDEHVWGDDFASYIMQARSLVEGNSSALLAANRFRISQSTSALAVIAYPWGYPALLAPLYAWFGIHIVAFKSLNLLCYLCFLALLAFAWPRAHSDFWRLVFVSLFAWNAYFQDFMNQVLSDVPFLLVSTFAILLMQRVTVARRWLISQTGDHVFLGLSIAIAWFIRANGLLLLGTLVLTQFIHAMRHSEPSNRRMLVLPYLSFSLAAAVWTALMPEWAYSPDLGYSFSFMASEVSKSRISEHIHYYVDLPAEFFTGVPHRELVYGASIPFAIAGMLQRRGSDYPMILYGTLTLVLYVVWPHVQGLRFLFPILPIYVHFVLIGLQRSRILSDRRLTAHCTFLRVLPAVVVLSCFVQTSIVYAITNQRASHPRVAGPYLPTSQQMFSYISQHTDPRSVIVFFKPRAMMLFGDRRSIAIREAPHLTRGDYLCVYLRPNVPNQAPDEAIARLHREGQLQSVYQNADFHIYRMNKSVSLRSHPPGKPVSHYVTGLS